MIHAYVYCWRSRIVIRWMIRHSSSRGACRLHSAWPTLCTDIARYLTIVTSLDETTTVYDINLRSFQMRITTTQSFQLVILNLTLHGSLSNRQRTMAVHTQRVTIVQNRQSMAYAVGLNDGESQKLRAKQTVIYLLGQHLSQLRVVEVNRNRFGWSCERVKVIVLLRKANQLWRMALSLIQSWLDLLMTMWSMHVKTAAKNFRVPTCWRNISGRTRHVFFTVRNVRPIFPSRSLSSATQWSSTKFIARSRAVILDAIIAPIDCQTSKNTCRSIHRLTHLHVHFVVAHSRRMPAYVVICWAACRRGLSSVTSAARLSIICRACSRISACTRVSVRIDAQTVTQRLRTTATTNDIVGFTTMRSRMRACCVESTSVTPTLSSHTSARTALWQSRLKALPEAVHRTHLTWTHSAFWQSLWKVLQAPQLIWVTPWLTRHFDEASMKCIRMKTNISFWCMSLCERSSCHSANCVQQYRVGQKFTSRK